MTTLYVITILVVIFLSAVAATTLAWMMYAWRDPEAMMRTGFPNLREPRHSFSLIVPARHEVEVLGRTLDKLADQTHPDVEIVCVVGHDDPGTMMVAQTSAARHPRIRVVTDHNFRKTKPKALNTALPRCRGEIIGVFDAEDDVHPDLLRHVDTILQERDDVDVVQCGVQLMNFWSNWFSVRNVLEYYFWFRSRLHFHANAGFIPLGGNTVFVRASVLREYGGWDGDCLAEDCDVGVRLSSAGHKTAVAYNPSLATQEETPPTLGALFRQRTRWNQGFLQVMKKGSWRNLEHRGQRALALYTLGMPFMQSIIGVIIPLSLLAIIFVDMPTPLALFTFLPLILLTTTVVLETAALHEFGKLFDKRVRARDYLRLIVGTIPYHLVLATAALRALVRFLRGEITWEKTVHVGAHLSAAQPIPTTRVDAPGSQQ